MIESFAFSEVVRKLANLIRIGKIAEIDGAQVKVQIGRVMTGWLPIVSTAGETTSWTPISKGEQVVVFSPYGESAQAFVLRSIHYNNYKAPDDKNFVTLNTNKAVEVKSEETGSVSFDKKLTFAVGESTVELSKNNIKINSGCSRIELSENNLILSAGDAVLAVSVGMAFLCLLALHQLILEAEIFLSVQVRLLPIHLFVNVAEVCDENT